MLTVFLKTAHLLDLISIKINKIVMKTKKQILEWLDKQSWKNEFYENCFKHRIAEYEYSEDFIITPFNWDSTKQGYEYWDKINTEYRKWYRSNSKPRSWDEYCDMDNPVLKSYIKMIVQTNKKWEYLKCGMPDELCKAFGAYAKLMQLRNAWIKNDEPSPCVHKIFVLGDSVKVITYPNDVKGLSFSSLATANDFIYTFKDLLEEAKPLL